MIAFAEDPDFGFQVITVSGVVSGEEVLAVYQNTVGSAAFRPEQDVLLNLSGVERFDFGYAVISEVDGILRAIDARGISHRMAIVVLTEYQFGMARTFQNARYGSPQRIEVFRDLESARAFLTDGAEPG